MNLADLLSEELPRIAVADCETDPFKKGRAELRPFLWGFFDGDDYREFTTTESFVAFVREWDGIIYAHNGGKFDWHFILPYMDGLQDLGIISGRLSRFRIGRAEFRDSLNILPISLGSYQKDEIDYAIMEENERHKPENWAAIRKYLRGDCTYLFNLVSQFIRKYGLHLTQAGASMKIWEKMSGVPAPRSTPAYYEHMSKYYFGGRVECFQTGIRNVKFRVADINSAYPRAMLEEHPLDTNPSAVKNLTPDQALKWLDKYGPGCVFLSITAKSRGAFPWRAADGALYFPRDNRKRVFHVTGWEYLAALETKTADVLSVERIEFFQRHFNFKSYVDHFYNMRLEAKARGDKESDIFAKIFLNGLYGKFASDPGEYECYTNLPPALAPVIGKPESKDAGHDLTHHHFSGLLGPWALAARPLTEQEMHFYNVATAASVTGYVRAFLWRTICATRNPIYCDTDSIAAEGFGEGIAFGKELGQWKDEGAFDRFAVGGRKLYAFRHDAKAMPELAGVWKTASKGVRLTAQEVEKIAAGEEVYHETDKPTFSIHREPRLVNRKIRAVHREAPEF